eukprot:2841751-Pleurochrysis_carterae.AAC.1
MNVISAAAWGYADCALDLLVHVRAVCAQHAPVRVGAIHEPRRVGQSQVRVRQPEPAAPQQLDERFKERAKRRQSRSLCAFFTPLMCLLCASEGNKYACRASV